MCTMFTAQVSLQTQRPFKTACRTPVPLQRLLAKFARHVPDHLFFSKCFHTDDELADASSIAKTGYFPDLRLFCTCASGTNSSNNEMKFEHLWTNNFIRIFDLFVSPLITEQKYFLLKCRNAAPVWAAFFCHGSMGIYCNRRNVHMCKNFLPSLSSAHFCTL